MEPLPVHTSREARDLLGATMQNFRDRTGKPLIFGAQRKPEAAIIPFELYQQIIPLLEDLEIAQVARERIDAGESEPLSDVAARLGLTVPGA